MYILHIIMQISIQKHVLLCLFLFLDKSSDLYVEAASKLDKQYTKSSVNDITLTCTLSVERAWVKLHLSCLRAHLIDSWSQFEAGERATQIKERSVSNGFPAASLQCKLHSTVS